MCEAITKWRHGDKARLLELANQHLKHPLSASGLSNILMRRARATPRQALALERAALQLGYKVTAYEWIYSMENDCPHFAPKHEEVSNGWSL